MSIERTSLLQDALTQPSDAVAYAITRSLKALCPERFLLYTTDRAFDFSTFVRDGEAHLASSDEVIPQIRTHYDYRTDALYQQEIQGAYRVTWHERPFEIWITFVQDGFGQTRHVWLLGDTREETEEFFRRVCFYASEVRGEVLVFDGGCWQKSQELFVSIKNSRFENLILPPRLKQELQNDFRQFLEAREVYHRYGLPWKRGALLTGPPGNGKTHTVKALIQQLEIPCLYVKSFVSAHETPQENIHCVFERAREVTPCILVLEDLDSLITDTTRSFFLNEMDGFAANDGIIVLATTNHPEKLDPALVDRPSRFDRKYPFELPALEERSAYLTLWNEKLDAALTLDAADIESLAELTEEFSFAFLKELVLSSLMHWISAGGLGSIKGVMREQVELLRSQMSSMNETPPELLLLDASDNADPYYE